jgi:hypothetical protein
MASVSLHFGGAANNEVKPVADVEPKGSTCFDSCSNSEDANIDGEHDIDVWRQLSLRNPPLRTVHSIALLEQLAAGQTPVLLEGSCHIAIANFGEAGEGGHAHPDPHCVWKALQWGLKFAQSPDTHMRKLVNKIFPDELQARVHLRRVRVRSLSNKLFWYFRDVDGDNGAEGDHPDPLTSLHTISLQRLFQAVIAPPERPKVDATAHELLYYYNGEIPSPLTPSFSPALHLAKLCRGQEPHQNLWISSAGVTAQTHFDTHENVLVQVVGGKTVELWPPNSTAVMRSVV